MTANSTPEIGQRVQLGDVTVNYHDIGQGDPVMLIHGSGPGVSSWVNWGKVAPILSQKFRLIMPDMIGFGYTEAPESRFDLDAWVGEVIDLADHLGISAVSVPMASGSSGAPAPSGGAAQSRRRYG